jgi:hypothetical protein
LASDQYLFRFGYSSPAAIRRSERYPDEDLEESTQMVFIRASSESDALRLGARLAEDFIHLLYGPDSYSWQALNFAHWIETEPSVLEYARHEGIPVLESSTDSYALAERLVARRSS